MGANPGLAQPREFTNKNNHREALKHYPKLSRLAKDAAAAAFER